MKNPNRVNITALRKQLTSNTLDESFVNNVGWLPARPEPYYLGFVGNLKRRLKLTWHVFLGKADALYWNQ